MKKIFISSIFFTTILFLLICLTLAINVEATHYDPSLNWQVLESPHFSVYFYLNVIKIPKNHNTKNNSNNINNIHNGNNSNNIKEIAQEVADIAEEAYQKVNTQIGSPKNHHLQKIAIIIEDFSDYTSGFALSFPHRTIRLSLTQPTAKSFDMKFKSWLKMVITHEYTHLAHFDMTGGLTTALRALFGQVIVPNGLQPTWSIEGLAVYNETKFTTGGRGIDARYDMYLRMATLEDNFNTLDQINGYYLTSWPDGTAPYVYGQSLIHFIAKKYGEDKVITLSKIFCRYPYLGMNYALRKTIGLNLNELYQTWKNYLKEKYQRQTQKIISQKKLTKSQQLTKCNYWVDYPKWISTPTGEKIVVRISTPHSYPFIQLINPLSSLLPLTIYAIKDKNHSVIKRTYGRDSSFGISPDNSKIIFSKLVNYKQFYKFYDLYLYNLKTNKQTRLSKGLRIRDPNWSPKPNNTQIVAVINESGINNLILINLHSSPSVVNKNQLTYEPVTKKNIVYLTNFHDDTQLYQPTWSPQGDKIALSIWREGHQDIYILNFNFNFNLNSLSNFNHGNNTNHNLSLSLCPIFQDQYNDLSPCWSPDGQYIFFSSDRNGIYNIFAYSLSDKKLYQVTNVLGGAFQPSVSPDGQQLAFINYHSTGYELHLMEVNPTKWLEIEDIEHTTNIKYIKNTENININSSISNSQIPTIEQTKHTNNNQFPEQTNKNLNISENNNYPIHSYNSLASLWPPTYWIPAATVTENDISIGFSSVLEDILGFSYLPFTITYGILNNTLNYHFNYYNYHYFPIINFYLFGNTSLPYQYRYPSSTSDQENNSQIQTSWWKEGKTGINLYFPYKGETQTTTTDATNNTIANTTAASTTDSRPYRQIFSLGYQYKKTTSIDKATSLDTNDNNNKQKKITSNNISSIRLGYSYSDVEKYGFSISPEQGQAFSINYEHADKNFGGDYTFNKLLFDGRKFIPLPFIHQVLSLRLIAGYSSTNILDEEKFKLGGHYSADNLSNIDVDTFSLRGYKSALLKGNNLFLTSLEYRFPLANIEHSLKLGPLPLSVFLKRLSGAFFIDIGNAWESTDIGTITDTGTDTGTSSNTNIDINSENYEINYNWRDFKTSIGAEVKADFDNKYDSPFILRLGAAKALSAPFGYDVYFTLGTSF